jgi:hypothetical protein
MFSSQFDFSFYSLGAVLIVIMGVTAFVVTVAAVIRIGLMLLGRDQNETGHDPRQN